MCNLKYIVWQLTVACSNLGYSPLPTLQLLPPTPNPLFFAEMAYKRCVVFAFLPPGRYQVVGGIVSPVSDGYGKQGLVPAKHRIAMARLALQSSNWVTVDEWESQQADWTETAVTMRYYSATAHTLWRKVIVIQGGWMWDCSGLCSLCAAVQVCWLPVQRVQPLHRHKLFWPPCEIQTKKVSAGKKS